MAACPDSGDPPEIWNHSEEIAWIQFAMMNPTDPVIVDPNAPLG